ncbi:hypothetical protein HDV04_004984 [Boothiomyces sp. JEL0838]|nr:hypothetical protein HDV04_004984 [Boothiomyces sp. JEL0838]
MVNKESLYAAVVSWGIESGSNEGTGPHSVVIEASGATVLHALKGTSTTGKTATVGILLMAVGESVVVVVVMVVLAKVPDETGSLDKERLVTALESVLEKVTAAHIPINCKIIWQVSLEQCQQWKMTARISSNYKLKKYV